MEHEGLGIRQVQGQIPAPHWVCHLGLLTPPPCASVFSLQYGNNNTIYPLAVVKTKLDNPCKGLRTNGMQEMGVNSMEVL